MPPWNASPRSDPKGQLHKAVSPVPRNPGLYFFMPLNEEGGINMKIFNTNCTDQWGWIRTDYTGVGPLKAKFVSEFAMADSCRDEARQLMYKQAVEESLTMPLANVKRKGPSTVVIKAPLKKDTYELAHWVHVE